MKDVIKYIKLCKTLVLLLQERQAHVSCMCPALTDREERKAEMKLLAQYTKEIESQTRRLQEFEKTHPDIGVNAVIDKADELDDCLFQVVAMLLISPLSEDLARSINDVAELILLTAYNCDEHAALTVRREFSINGLLWSLCDIGRPGKRVDDMRISVKEEVFQRGIPHSKGLSYQLDDNQILTV